MKTKKPPQVAKQEAFEETGLVGKIVGKSPLGSYYSVEADKADVLTEVLVYSFQIKNLAREITARHAVVRCDRCRLLSRRKIAELAQYGFNLLVHQLIHIEPPSSGEGALIHLKSRADG